MRDYLILAIILGATPICFFRPYFGILMWTWVAYFNPHRFTWGAAYNFPVAMLIGGATIAGIPFARQVNRRLMTLQTVLLLLLWAWFSITYLHAAQEPLFAHHIADSRLELERISKILIMTFLTIWLVSSKEKLRYLFLVITFSFGFIAIKGTLFVWQTSGEFRVYGPPDSFIEDNNALGLALNMSLPMFYFMARSEENKWVRRFLHLAFFCGAVAVILTYSRGALLGLSVVLVSLALKSKQRILAGFFLVFCAWSVLTFAPAKWMDRMGNFFHGNLDNSAELRLNAWQFAVELAKDFPVTGGGLKTFTPELYQRYTPELEFAGPHSIYFQTLGEHGFVGLALFLLLLGCCLAGLVKLRRQACALPSASWIIPYTDMLQVALLAFMISGAFLELANFDLFYQVVGAVIILKILYRREVALANEQAKVVIDVELSPSGDLVEARYPLSGSRELIFGTASSNYGKL
jgi:putative inorganic carbon (HCO3(-)) transporter